jgi:NADH-quinone oxidoreductase subunit C
MAEEQKPTAEKPKPAPPAPKAPPVAPVTEIQGDPFIELLKTRFEGAIHQAVESYGLQELLIERERTSEICRFLHDDPEAGFDFLTDVTARHLPARPKPFQVIYHLYAFARNRRLRIKVDLSDAEAAQSVVGVWASANWMEREVYDLFGIGFEGHPDLRRLLLPEDWEGHPLRKDYPMEFRYNRWTREHLHMVPFEEGTEYPGKFE